MLSRLWKNFIGGVGLGAIYCDGPSCDLHPARNDSWQSPWFSPIARRAKCIARPNRRPVIRKSACPTKSMPTSKNCRDSRTWQLRSLWLQLFAKPPQLKLQRDVMIPVLAYQIQEDTVLHGFGGQRGLLSFGGSS